MIWGNDDKPTRVTADGEVLPPALERMANEDIEKLIKAIIAVTRRDPKLWMMIDDKADPYLTADGCKLVALAFHLDIGVASWEAPERTGEADENGDELVGYTCHITGRRRLPDGTVRSYSADGHAMSDLRQIVALRKKGSLTRGEALTRTREMAQARSLNRVITGLMGTPAITWDDLDHNGISRDDVKKRDDGRGGSGGSGGSNRSASGGPSKADKDFLFDALKNDKDALNAAVNAVIGHFKKIPDMTAEQARAVVAHMKGETAPKQQGASGPDFATTAQRERFDALIFALKVDGNAVLKRHGWSGDGPPTREQAAAAIAEMERQQKGPGPATDAPAEEQGGFADDDIPF